MTEAALISSCQAGNYEDFSELYENYAEKVYNFIYYKVMHKQTAEDICSTTFMKALENIQKYSSEQGKFSTWIFTIARNNVTDHFRSHKQTQNIDDVWDLSSSEDIEDATHTKLQFEKLQKHLIKLKPEQREILLMKFWQDLKYKEIAEITGKSEASIKMNLSRTVKKLSKEALLLLLLLQI